MCKLSFAWIKLLTPSSGCSTSAITKLISKLTPWLRSCTVLMPKVVIALPVAVRSSKASSGELSWIWSAKLRGATDSSAPVSIKMLQACPKFCLGDLQARGCCSKLPAGCCSPIPKLLLLACCCSWCSEAAAGCCCILVVCFQAFALWCCWGCWVLYQQAWVLWLFFQQILHHFVLRSCCSSWCFAEAALLAMHAPFVFVASFFCKLLLCLFFCSCCCWPGKSTLLCSPFCLSASKLQVAFASLSLQALSLTHSSWLCTLFVLSSKMLWSPLFKLSLWISKTRFATSILKLANSALSWAMCGASSSSRFPQEVPPPKRQKLQRRSFLRTKAV